MTADKTPYDEDDFSHYYNATARLSAKLDTARAELAALRERVTALCDDWERDAISTVTLLADLRAARGLIDYRDEEQA